MKNQIHAKCSDKKKVEKDEIELMKIEGDKFSVEYPLGNMVEPYDIEKEKEL